MHHTSQPIIKRSKILQLIDALLKDTESQCVSLHFELKPVYMKRLRDVTTQSHSRGGWCTLQTWRTTVFVNIVIYIWNPVFNEMKWRKNEGKSKILDWESGMHGNWRIEISCSSIERQCDGVFLNFWHYNTKSKKYLYF